MSIFNSNPLLLLLLPIFSLLLILLLLLSKTSLLQILLSHYNSLLDNLHVYTFYRIPQTTNNNTQPNPLYTQIQTYLNSLPSLETDTQSMTLLSGPKPNDIILIPDPTWPISDTFLGSRLSWSYSSNQLTLKLKKKDKKRILKPYLEKILSSAEENKQLNLHLNLNDQLSWFSVPFNHPATLETLIMDVEVKNKVKSELESFLKSKQYYHRIGRVWKRSYLLHGGSGTGKSTFISAMANFLRFDLYDLDLSRVSTAADLKTLILKTARRSVIAVENLERFPAIWSFINDVISCCGEERVILMTCNSDKIDSTVIKQWKTDTRIEFPTCDNFSTFKMLASSYLGVKEHKFYREIEEIFGGGGISMSPAEIGEIMMVNRGSTGRALKAVITALGKRNSGTMVVRSRSISGGGEEELFGRESSVNAVKEFKNLYGLLRLGSKRKSEDAVSFDHLGNSVEKDGSRHDQKDGSRHDQKDGSRNGT